MEKHHRFDTLHASTVICPYCGFESDRDISGAMFDEGVDATYTDCEDCEKIFLATREVSVDYCTFKVDQVKDGDE